MSAGTSNSGLSTSPAPSLKGSVFGAGLVGLCLNMFLCGISVSQAYYYFNEYTEDSRWLKALVWFATSLSLLHAITVCIGDYHYLVQPDTSMVNNLRTDWTTPGSLAVYVAVAVTVLLYFTFVCFRLFSGKKIQIPATIVLSLPILTLLGLGITVVIQTSNIQNLSGFRIVEGRSLIPMLAVQLAADVIISVTLCLALPQPSYKHTRDVMQRIIIYTASRGILTSATALVELVMIVVDPSGFWFAIAEASIPGLYANSLLSALNSRKDLRRRLENWDTNPLPPCSTIGFHRPTLTCDTQRVTSDVTSNTEMELDVFSAKKSPGA